MPTNLPSIDLNVLIGVLYALVGVMLLIVLYHVLFIVVDLRKISKRMEDLTSQVETILLKPLSIADQGVQWVVEFIERKRRERRHQQAHHVHGHAKEHGKK